MSAGPLALPKAPRRLVSARGITALSPVVAVVLALATGAIFIAAIGERPLEIYGLIARGCFGDGYGFGQTLFKSTPLAFTGLAVALAFRAGLFNIGAEGQLYLGGFAAALVGAALAGWPAFVLLPLALIAAAVAGGLWGAIPGVLKARFGAHEVINTIMLNVIAFAIVAWLGRFVFQPATVRTATIGPGAALARLDLVWPALRGSPANLAFVLALLVDLGTHLLLTRTRRGYALRAVGLNPAAAEYGGVSIGRTQVLAMTLSGAIAGLGGTNFALGYKHYFEQGFSGGAGYLGIAVALLGRNHPAGVLIAALFFGALSYGGLVINARVPKELVDVLEGLVILFAISAQQVIDRMARRMT